MHPLRPRPRQGKNAALHWDFQPPSEDLAHTMTNRPHFDGTQMGSPKRSEHATPLNVAFWNRPSFSGPTSAPSRANGLVLGNAHASGDCAPNALWLETDIRCGPGLRFLKDPWDNPQQGIWNPDELPLGWMEAFDKFLPETRSPPDYPRALCVDMSAGLDQSGGRTHYLREIRNHLRQPQQPFNHAEVPGTGLATTYSGASCQPVPTTKVSSQRFASATHQM